MNTIDKIALRLKECRIKAGYTSARSFAQQHNIPYITYSQHEAGKRKLTPDRIVMYSNYLKINPAYLFSGIEDTNNPNTKSENFISHSKKEKPIFMTNIDIDKINHTNNEINGELLGDLFIEVSQLLDSLDITMTDKNKIILCVDLYKKICISPLAHNERFTVLKYILNSISSLKVQQAS